ncbi:MAG: DUF4231 domain-containing protein [Candidatus Saccharimonas sp.]|nr:DUF4231 domain-containing protein [Planctomycetaceae bacterium]
MTDDQFDEYLKTRYYPEIDWYTRRGNRAKMCYLVLQWGLIVLSACTPILISVGFRGAGTAASALELTHIQVMSIAASFLVAVFSAAIKVFHFQENWLDFRAVQEQLTTEIHIYHARLYGYKTTHDPRALFVGRVERMIRGEVRSWESRMQPSGAAAIEFPADDTTAGHPSSPKARSRSASPT